ncbi:UDP-N-acetylmuramoyl-L-alanyl-D-glutamate--2,6-diaminopimelate ligase [Halothiobacillus sp. DCM-1]|uniref:UDP-N-acetylmuramoyl-L-alanyl-D-glutamate--2, 6-diaminopimelate ligase n=1 Tax=Halothiobacillus sp. DCM-1 TaxID=3112558 RepID=UPI00324417E3
MSILSFSPRSLAALGAAVGLPIPAALADLAVSGLTDDTRTLAADRLLLLRPSPQAEQYLAQALAQPVAAVIAPWGIVSDDPRVLRVVDWAGTWQQLVSVLRGQAIAAMTLIGVTGTNGKTSVTHFIAQLLLGSGAPHTEVIGVIGTLGAGRYTAGSVSWSPTANTTPGLLETLILLADFAAQGVRYVAMEVSSHALDQDRVAGLPIRVAVFTNLSRDHLDYHRDMDRYLAAKLKLFSRPGLMAAISNVDGDWIEALCDAMHPDADCWVYGAGAAQGRAADCHHIALRRLKILPQGLSMAVDTPFGAVTLAPPLLGRFNAANVLAAFSAVLALGMPLPAAQRAVATLTPPPGRLQQIGLPNGARAVVDYAHTPDALAQVLQALAAHRSAGAKIYCVFGCGGDRDTGKRPQMGAVADRLADGVILTNDNPRSEDPASILAAIAEGMTRPPVLCPDRAAAIFQALTAAAPGDWVLIAGKGHETTQIQQDVVIPFSDAAVVADWVRAQQRAGVSC